MLQPGSGPPLLWLFGVHESRALMWRAGIGFCPAIGLTFTSYFLADSLPIEAAAGQADHNAVVIWRRVVAALEACCLGRPEAKARLGARALFRVDP